MSVLFFWSPTTRLHHGDMMDKTVSLRSDQLSYLRVEGVENNAVHPAVSTLDFHIPVRHPKLRVRLPVPGTFSSTVFGSVNIWAGCYSLANRRHLRENHATRVVAFMCGCIAIMPENSFLFRQSVVSSSEFLFYSLGVPTDGTVSLVRVQLVFVQKPGIVAKVCAWVEYCNCRC
jgi:hypothetical protein